MNFEGWRSIGFCAGGEVVAKAALGEIGLAMNGGEDAGSVDLDGFHDGIVEKNICTNSKGVEAYPFGGSAIVMNNTHPDTHSSNIEISGNVIEGSKFGGLFLMGSRNRVIDNVFLGLNLAYGDEPELLTAGVYLSRGLARLEETTGNVIRGNRILGYKMKTRCIVYGPGVSRAANTVEGNTCADEPPAR